MLINKLKGYIPVLETIYLAVVEPRFLAISQFVVPTVDFFARFNVNEVVAWVCPLQITGSALDGVLEI